MLTDGHEVSCLDEDPDSHARLELGLDSSWEDEGGQFTVGTGLEIDALLTAGIEDADVFVASTNGDNTNIVIAQIAQRRFRGRDGDRADPRPLPGRVVRAAGAADDLPDPDRDRELETRLREIAGDRTEEVTGDGSAMANATTCWSSAPARSAGT